jgi:fatty acid desaturase
LSANPEKSLDDIIKQREAREAIISTEEALEIRLQEEIWEQEAKEETHLFEEIKDVSPEQQTFERLPDNHVYTAYEDVDKDQLQRDIEEIKEKLGPVSNDDFQHLLKLERWSRGATYIGFFMIYLIAALEVSIGLGSFGFWTLGIISAVLIGVGNVSRWSDVTHPILHGAYDKVPNIPLKYKKKGYARGTRRYVDWLDWIKPDAWEYEHNIMHHYHLGEDDDPDNVEKNLTWLRESSAPFWAKRLFVYAFACAWKPLYYAPNTLRILDNKERRKNKLPETKDYNYLPTNDTGKKLWKDFYLPYGLFQFVAMPLLFLPLGWSAVATAFTILVMAEVYANLHSFLVILPNHSAGDIYQFSKPHKSQGEFYLRQIMGSVNYNTGTDLIDFAQGFLNYQIEHHLFPNTPHSYQQRMQPLVKEVCRKHNIEYRQESVWKRMGMTVDLMIGKDSVLRVDGV